MNAFIAGYKAPGTFKDKGIRAALSLRHQTLVPYSHVEILEARPFQSLDQTKFQNCVAASKRDHSRVREKTIIFKPDSWDFIELHDSGSSDLWENALKRIGKPYDTSGAMLCITPWARMKTDAEWCSGMIADILGWEKPETYDPYMIMKKARSLGGEVIEG